MKGQTLKEFLNDMLIEGGFEKEFLYKGKEWFIGRRYEKDFDRYNLYILDEGEGPNCNIIFDVHGSQKGVYDKFIKARIFDGRTIFEAEQDIEVTTIFS